MGRVPGRAELLSVRRGVWHATGFCIWADGSWCCVDHFVESVMMVIVTRKKGLVKLVKIL